MLVRSPLGVLAPPIHGRVERCRVDEMELVPPLPKRLHEPGPLEHVQVLRHGLTREAHAVLHREPRAELEQRLTVPLMELVEDGAPRGSGQGVEDVDHEAR